MQKVIYDQPVIRGALRRIALWFMRHRGWKITGTLPPEKKFVAILAHHTSNWDFPIGVSVILHYRVRVFWLGKNSLFRFFMGPVMRWLGGIPVFRSDPVDLVDRLVNFLKGEENVVIAIAPEGTRGRVEKWKTGFYRVAHSLKLPIILAYLDYESKTCGIGPTIYPTGDFDADMAKIRAFYITVNGKFPDKGSFVNNAEY